MHTCSPKFHTMHNPIDFVNDQANDAHRRASHQFSDCSDSTISQALEIADLFSGQALINPELRPQRRLSVCGMNAAGEVQRWFPSKERLSGDRGDGRQPCEDGILAVDECRPLRVQYIS